MADVNRTIQLKRNQIPSLNATEAKQRIIAIDSQLANGEVVINTYMDSNARNGLANLLGIKAQNKLFFIDNQVILNKLGINDDGTVNENITDSLEKVVEALEAKVGNIVTASGLESGGTYAADVTDEILSGATSLKDADKKLSDEVQAIEAFVGMGDEGGDSLVDRIVAISGKSITDVEDTATIDFTKEDATDGTKKIKADVKLSAVSGNILTIKEDGLYTEVDYDSVTNALIINGVEKPLNVGSIVDDIRYDSATEELIIDYTKSDGTSGETRADLKDLIEEYDFVAADEDHNVGFTVTRNISGSTTIQADVANIDCGEY